MPSEQSAPATARIITITLRWSIKEANSIIMPKKGRKKIGRKQKSDIFHTSKKKT